MRIYDVSHGQQQLATVAMQDNGEIQWVCAPDTAPEHGLSADTKRALAEAIALIPTAEVLTVLDGIGRTNGIFPPPLVATPRSRR